MLYLPLPLLTKEGKDKPVLDVCNRGAEIVNEFVNTYKDNT